MNSQSKIVEIIGVPLDLGANIRGATMGPDAIRLVGLHEKIKNLGINVEDSGNLNVPVRETLGKASVDAKFLPEIVSVCDELRRLVEQALSAGRLPITIGGDHSLAIGSIAGVSNYCKERGQNLGVLWFDAHADLNTPKTSPTGNIHGMPLSVVLGDGHPELRRIGGERAKVEPRNVALIGIRTLDAEERRICKESGINYYTMREIDERGMAAVVRDALTKVGSHTDALHVSLDIDSVDPQYAPGVSTPETGGLSYREIHLALEMIADSGRLAAIDVVELNPMCDHALKTAILAVELIQSALGKSIV